ncbi:MAG: HEAT repeat domain-containing protein [Phormidesmis sp.]
MSAGATDEGCADSYAESDLTTSELTASDLEKQIEQMIEALAAGDFHSRWHQSKLLSQQFSVWGDRALPLLIQHLQTQQDPDTQWFLVRILSQFQDPTVVSALAELLVTTDSESLQAEICKGLTASGTDAIATLSHLLAQPATEHGADFGTAFTAQRLLAARTLGHIRRAETIAPLISITKDPDPQLREIAVEALGSFHDLRITPILLGALSDIPPICVEAIRTLGRRRDLLATVDLVTPLAQCLRSENQLVGCESAIALGRLGSEAAVTALGEHLTKAIATPVKLAIAQSLGWLNVAAAVTYLAEAFDYNTPVIMPTVKQAIAKALGQTREPPLKSIAARPLVAWLNASQTEPKPEPKQPLALGGKLDLEANSVPDSPDFLLMQTVLSAIARLDAVDALDSLIGVLSHPDLRLRIHALNALKQIDPRSAQSEIQAYLRRDTLSPMAKQNVVEALSAW